jgi:hypothetical protein
VVDLAEGIAYQEYSRFGIAEEAPFGYDIERNPSPFANLFPVLYGLISQVCSVEE